MKYNREKIVDPKQVFIVLSRELNHTLKTVMKRSGMNKSMIVRKLLTDVLDKNSSSQILEILDCIEEGNV